jgi:hypothetical protein
MADKIVKDHEKLAEREEFKNYFTEDYNSNKLETI